MIQRVCRIVLVCTGLVLTAAAHAQGLHRESFFIPAPDSGPLGLEAMLIRPDGAARYPLAIISHGAPRKPSERKTMSPWAGYPAALEFARRGFAAVVVMRRGYGKSGGDYAESSGPCGNPDYVQAGRISAGDIKSATEQLSRRPDIDNTRILAVGQSAGGLATIALTADAPPGLVAAINFAGGRGSQNDFEVCREDKLVSAFGTFGRTSRVPTLWVYTENDYYFAPPLAAKFHQAFTASGGKAYFIKAPAFGKDGHSLFYAPNGAPVWTAYVDEFLAKQKLTPRQTLLPLPMPTGVTLPENLSARGREAFETYIRAGQHKAFAVSASGGFGWATRKQSIDEAKEAALNFCREHSQSCRLLAVDDAGPDKP